MNASNVENLSPQTIRSLGKELAILATDPPEGIKILINHGDITDIQALIDGPAGTPYYGGQFHVRLVLGKEFPQGPPKGFFVTKIFHPNVSRSGEICVNTLKKDWKSDLGIKHILLTIKCLLIVPNAESALNEEAGHLLLEAYEDYERRAKMMTEVHARPVEKLANNQTSNTANSEKSTTTGGDGLKPGSSTRRLVVDDSSEPPSSSSSSSSQNPPSKRLATESNTATSSSSKAGTNQNKSTSTVSTNRSVKDRKRILKRL